METGDDPGHMGCSIVGGGSVARDVKDRGEESAEIPPGHSPEAREFFGRGMLLLARGATVAAADCFREALALDPSFTESAGYLAWAGYLASGAKLDVAEAALRELRRLVERDVRFAPRGHLLMAYVREATRDIEGAAREVGVSLHLDPDLADARALLASFPEELRLELTAALSPATEAGPSGHSIKRLLLMIALAVVGLGGFTSSAVILYRSSPSAPRIMRIGAEDFMDIAHFMRISVEGRRFKGMLERAGDMTSAEKRRTLDALCRRVAEKGFTEGIFVDDAWKPLGSCRGDQAVIAHGDDETGEASAGLAPADEVATPR